MKLLFLMCALILTVRAEAVTFKLYVAVTPPFVMKSGEGVAGLSGMYGKIVADKITKSGHAEEFEVIWVPWKRALAQTLKTQNALFFPLGRSAEREKKFAWLGHLGNAESWFYSVRPDIHINQLSDLKKYRIGFLNGSMRESELRKILGQNASNLEGLNNDLSNYKKLLSGRIDMWVTQTEVFEKARFDYALKNKKNPEVHALRKFLDQEIWIASSSEMDKKLQDKIKSIFDSNKNAEDSLKTSARRTLSSRSKD